MAQIAPQIEDRGIDEIYIDLTDLPDAGHTLAVLIKQAVHQATGLTCSIGITPNKLLSKMASELDKPDGITILTENDIPTRIGPLAVSKVGGIGPKATLKLKDLGIHTIADLAGADACVLQQHFGATYAAWLQDVARGVDERPVKTVRETKSVSRETTFERDLHPRQDRATLSAVFTELCQRLAGDLQRKGLVSRTIGIKLRFEDFRTVTQDLSLEVPTDEALLIRRAAGQCLKRIALQGRIRLLGVRAAALMPAKALEHSDRCGPRQMVLIEGV